MHRNLVYLIGVLLFSLFTACKAQKVSSTKCGTVHVVIPNTNIRNVKYTGFKLWNDTYCFEKKANANKNLVWNVFENIPEGVYSFCILQDTQRVNVQIDSVLVHAKKTSYINMPWYHFLAVPDSISRDDVLKASYSIYILINPDSVKIKWDNFIKNNNKYYTYKGTLYRPIPDLRYKIKDSINPNKLIEFYKGQKSIYYTGIESESIYFNHNEILTCTDGKNKYKSKLDENSQFNFTMPAGTYYCYIDTIYTPFVRIHTLNDENIVTFSEKDTIVDLFYNVDIKRLDFYPYYDLFK